MHHAARTDNYAPKVEPQSILFWHVSGHNHKNDDSSHPLGSFKFPLCTEKSALLNWIIEGVGSLPSFSDPITLCTGTLTKVEVANWTNLYPCFDNVSVNEKSHCKSESADWIHIPAAAFRWVWAVTRLQSRGFIQTANSWGWAIMCIPSECMYLDGSVDNCWGKYRNSQKGLNVQGWFVCFVVHLRHLAFI